MNEISMTGLISTLREQPMTRIADKTEVCAHAAGVVTHG